MSKPTYKMYRIDRDTVNGNEVPCSTRTLRRILMAEESPRYLRRRVLSELESRAREEGRRQGAEDTRRVLIP